jgi:hypothetical protein
VTVDLAHLGLALDLPFISEERSNFRPSSWPPAPDFPVVLDAKGSVISRFGDPVWDLTVWAGTSAILNFGDKRLCRKNAELLKLVVAWWLYGPAALRHARTLRSAFYDVRHVFVLCTEHGILASDLWRFPAVAEKLSSVLKGSIAENVLTRLHILHAQKDEIGFQILDREGLARLESSLPEHTDRQTPYIPPRIWMYQVARLKEFLEDFLSNKENIESCFKFCLAAYAANSSGVSEACRVGRKRETGPFWSQAGYTGAISGLKYCGPFIETASRFGIAQLLHKWCGAASVCGEAPAELSIKTLSTYFTLATYVGKALILNFSLMRVEEADKLRSNCLEIENDERFGPIHIIHGATTKTIDDDDARWPTSPHVGPAIEVLSCVSRLRMICGEANPDVPTTVDDVQNPPIIVRAYEPWATANAADLTRSLSIRPNLMTYAQVVQQYPRLMDVNELKITEGDFSLALLVNPDLDTEKFAVGKVWTLAWHQLRRTGAVNMQASGLISDASLQYLLKHASRAMSLYYGQGFSRLRPNDRARLDYLRTMYEVLGKEISALFSDRYISPHGEKRKAEILRVVRDSDAKKLATLAKAGTISWRVNLLGGCTKRGPCPYGGVDNLVHCGGGDGSPPCADVLYDKEKGPKLSQLQKVIEHRFSEAPLNSPDQEALKAQRQAVRNALHAIAS